MATGKSTKREFDERWLGLLLSLLLHVFMVAAILLRPEVAPPPLELPTIDISIEPPLRQPKAPVPPQIAPPSEEASIKPPDTAKFESERDSSTEHEQIRRGTEGGPLGEKSPQQPQKPQKPSPQKPRTQPQPKPDKAPKPRENQKQAPPSRDQPAAAAETKPLKNLLLDNSTLAKKFGQENAQPARSAPQTRPSDLASYQAFSRPQGSGASFLGTGGVSDHLPNLPDGDITLLNAKASTYAGFVRRVAVQVFSNLRTQGWEQLSRAEIQQMGGFSTIEAVLSKSGQLIEARLIEPSGSTSFDRVLNQAVTRGARDPNPPKGAEASDGNIHFIFKARSWAEAGSNPRSGAPFERRWLLLATGLE